MIKFSLRLRPLLYAGFLMLVGFCAGVYSIYEDHRHIKQEYIKDFSKQLRYAIVPKHQVFTFLSHHSNCSYYDTRDLCFHVHDADEIITQSIFIDEEAQHCYIIFKFDPKSNLLHIQQYRSNWFDFNRTINLLDLIKTTQLMKQSGQSFELDLHRKNLVILIPDLNEKKDPFLESTLVIRNLSGQIDNSGHMKIDLITLTSIVDYFCYR